MLQITNDDDELMMMMMVVVVVNAVTGECCRTALQRCIWQRKRTTSM